MIFAVLIEQLICTKPTMPFTHGNVLHCCFHYRMFEYQSFPLYSVHMKQNLLSTCDMYLFLMLHLTAFAVFSRRGSFRLYIPLSACNNKCERKNKFYIPASDVVLETCNSSPMVPVKVVLSQESVK
jgi:hypothetical protein